MVDTVIFWTFATFAILGGVQLVFNPSLIYGALGLLTTFLSIAGLFLLNNADFLAIAQVLVYAVGLTIIILFAIMFTGDKPVKSALTRPTMIGYGIVTAYLAITMAVALKYPFDIGNSVALRAFGAGAFSDVVREGTSARLGFELFNKYGLPFELASLLLLAAMIGAIVISKKQFADDVKSTVKYSLSQDSQIPEGARQSMTESVYSTGEKSETKTEPENEAVSDEAEKEPVGAAK